MAQVRKMQQKRQAYTVGLDGLHVHVRWYWEPATE